MTIRESIDAKVREIGLRRAAVLLPLLLLVVAVVFGTCGFLMDDKHMGRLGPLVILLIGGLAIWTCTALVDALFFRRSIRCPCCNASLWPHIIKHIKVRRFRLPQNILNCPSCRADWSRTMEAIR